MRISELTPQMGTTVGAPATPVAAPQPASGPAPTNPDAAKAQAMAVKQIQDQKKQLQDQIKAKELELSDLRKKLAEIG